MGRRHTRIIDALGKNALLQLQAQGVDVSKQLQQLNEPVSAAARSHKYNVSAKEARTCDGLVFDSKAEMRVYQLLKQKGLNFDRQVKFVLQEKYRDPVTNKAVRSVKYVADFVLHRGDQVDFILDVKGMVTPVYRLKEKLMARSGKTIYCLRNEREALGFLYKHGFLI